MNWFGWGDATTPPVLGCRIERAQSIQELPRNRGDRYCGQAERGWGFGAMSTASLGFYRSLSRLSNSDASWRAVLVAGSLDAVISREVLHIFRLPSSAKLDMKNLVSRPAL